MSIDLSQILVPIGTFVGGGGLAVLVRAYTTKREHDSRDHALDVSVTQLAINTVVSLLEKEQAAHARTRDRLSQSQTESDMRGGQVGDLAARVEMFMAQVAELRSDMAVLDRKNDDCEQRNAKLAARVFALEGNRKTPANDTPAVGGVHAR